MNIPALWLFGLPQPKPARSVLDALEAMRPGGNPSDPGLGTGIAGTVRAAGTEGARPGPVGRSGRRRRTAPAWGPSHGKTPAGDTQTIGRWLDCWAKPDRFGESFRRGLREYYEVFYREEERRILPDLERSLARAQELAGRVSDGRAVREALAGHPGRISPAATRARAGALLVVLAPDPLHEPGARPAGGAVRRTTGRGVARAGRLGAGRAAARPRGALGPHAPHDPAGPGGSAAHAGRHRAAPAPQAADHQPPPEVPAHRGPHRVHRRGVGRDALRRASRADRRDLRAS